MLLTILKHAATTTTPWWHPFCWNLVWDLLTGWLCVCFLMPCAYDGVLATNAFMCGVLMHFEQLPVAGYAFGELGLGYGQWRCTYML